MEGLLIIVALLLGALLAIGISKAGLQLILSFVPGNDTKAEGRDEDVKVQAART